MEEFHRNASDRRLSLVGIVYCVVAVLVATALVVWVGGPLAAWAAVFLWATGGFFGLVGLVMLLASMRPFRIAMNEVGLEVRSEGHVFVGPWSDVEAISIEQTPPVGSPPKSRAVLVLWVGEQVRMRHRATFPPTGTGPKGHVLLELASLRESRDQIAQMLHRYAGPRFGTPVSVSRD